MVLFIDGQKIAKKLCSSISKESKVAQRLLEEYNEATCELSCADPPASLQDVLSLKSDFWVQVYPSVSNPSVPWKTREEIIPAFLTMKRSQEELALLQSDMICTVKYWHPRIQNLVEQLKAQEHSEDQYMRGTNSMLRKMKRGAELQCQKAISMFSAFVMIPSDVSVQARVHH